MARSKKDFERIYGGKERVAWVASLGCPLCMSSPCENVHAKSGGMGRKADHRFILPLCPHHHRELHRVGHKSFEEKYRISLLGLAEWTAEEWERLSPTENSSPTESR